MIEGTGSRAVLAQARRVYCRSVRKHRRCRRVAIGDVVVRTAGIHLLDPKIVSIISERVGCAARVGYARYTGSRNRS